MNDDDDDPIAAEKNGTIREFHLNWDNPVFQRPGDWHRGRETEQRLSRDGRYQGGYRHGRARHRHR